jgi:ABC-type sugar transport system ATPase subunit
MPPVSFDRITKRFGDVRVVEEFSLDVADGELLVLVGGSGSGKSTILRMVAGLETVTTGTIRIGDRDITQLAPRDRDVAMVFQDYALYPHLTVRDNLSLGLRLRKVPKTEIVRRVAWAGGVLGLEPLLDRKPKQLSGGQRQRVAMGRAMVREPTVFLFDEPLSNLDAGLRAQMRIEIGALQRRLKTTAIYVTHDQVEAMTLGDRIVVLANGRIQQVGRPIDLYRRPLNRFVAGFIGTPPMNFIEGGVRSENGRASFVAESVSLPLPGERLAAAEPRTLGIRPEDLRITSGDVSRVGAHAGELTGRVVLVERLGGTSHIHLDVGPHRLLAAVVGDPLPEVGDAIRVEVPAGQVHLFAADGGAV